MTLDAERQPGSKRLPTLEVGDNGAVLVELWCKGGTARFSIAGSSVVFVPGAMQERNCPPAKAQADDELLAALAEATSWSREGDLISFVGPQTLPIRPQHQLIAVDPARGAASAPSPAESPGRVRTIADPAPPEPRRQIG